MPHSRVPATDPDAMYASWAQWPQGLVVGVGFRFCEVSRKMLTEAAQVHGVTGCNEHLEQRVLLARNFAVDESKIKSWMDSFWTKKRKNDLVDGLLEALPPAPSTDDRVVPNTTIADEIVVPRTTIADVNKALRVHKTTGYLVFANEPWERSRKTGVDFTETNAEIADAWNNLSVAEKAVYEKAAKDINDNGLMRVSDLTGPARKRMIDRLYTTIRVAGEALEALEIHSKTTLFNTTNFSERMYLHGATAYRVVDVLGKKNVEANKIFTYAAGAMRCDGPGVDGEDLLKIMSAHYAKKLVDTLNVLLSEARLERVDAMPWTALEEGTIAGHSLSLGGWPTFVALKAEAPPVHCKIIKKLLKADQIKFELGPLVQQ